MGPALNAALAGLWRKDPGRADALGNPDFDQLAIESSSITELLCTDTYHIGKSIRKKGFTADPLITNLSSYEDEINGKITRWMEADSPITIRSEGDSTESLTSRRYWRAALDGRDAEMPCGGTHAGRLSEIGEVRASLEMPDAETLIIRTSVR
jgi:alanyl-tRNA synthetase